MLKTIDRYILKELLRPTLFGLMVFGSLWMVNLMIRMADFFVSKGVAVSAVVKIFLYSTPGILVTAAPMASLLGALLAMGRLNGDSEIIAAKGCGISYGRMMVPVFCMGLAMSCTAFVFNDWVVPFANERRELILTNEVILKKPLPRVAKDVFFDGGSFRVFVRSYDPESEEMQEVTCYQFQKDGFPMVTEAELAKLHPNKWVFRNGVTHVYRPDGSLERSVRFASWTYPFRTKHGTYVPQDDDPETCRSHKDPKEMSFLELLKYIRCRRSKGVDTRREEVDLWFKTAFPFANLFLVLVGTPLAARNLRSGGSGVGLSILLMFVYYVLLATGKALGDGGKLTPFLGAWAPNIVMGLVAVWLIRGARR